MKINPEFEKAALLRDQVNELKRASGGSLPTKESGARPVAYRRSSGKRR